MTPEDICRLAPVIPVLTIDDPAQAAPLARALVAGGLRVLEVTLRTPAALEAIRRMAEAEPRAIVGAGTLLSPGDLEAAVAAGARFGVSPGFTGGLLDAADAAGLPMLPGVATPGEAMRALERGLDVLKFFPRRTERRGGGAEGLGCAPAADPVLPDRRDRAGERGRVSLPAECPVRRRQLGGARSGGCRGRVGRDRTTGKARCGACMRDRPAAPANAETGRRHGVRPAGDGPQSGLIAGCPHLDTMLSI